MTRFEGHAHAGRRPRGEPGRPNWVASRVSKTSDSLDRAFEEGLTGHVITARDGKRVQLTTAARPWSSSRAPTSVWSRTPI